MRSLFSGDLPVAYGQFYLVAADHEMVSDLNAAFSGQVNGLCGAAVPGELFFVTGLHTGTTALSVEAHDARPQLGDQWEEVVEVSFVAREVPLILTAWGGMGTWQLDVASGEYRVRYCASGMDVGREADTRLDDDGVLDRYLLQLWPEPRGPDGVIRATGETAASWHTFARSLPLREVAASEEGPFRHPPTVEELLRRVGADPSNVPPLKEGRSAPSAGAVAASTAMWQTAPMVSRAGSAPSLADLPVGLPPRAGFVSADGRLVVGADGNAETVDGGMPNGVFRAYRTAFGTLVTGLGQPALLVAPGGGRRVVGSARLDHFVAVSDDGRYLAFTESHSLRNGSWWRPSIVDLKDGTVRPLPWDERRRVGVLALHQQVLYLAADPPDGNPGAGWLRWPIGGDFEAVEGRLLQRDASSGIVLIEDPFRGALVIGLPDGTEYIVDPEMSPRLVPGGRNVYRYDYNMPALKITDLSNRHRRTFALPSASRVGDSGPGRPVWEDNHRMVLMLEHSNQADALRVDIDNGKLEVLHLNPEPGYRPILVEPYPAGGY
jgi:hypothetical protein